MDELNKDITTEERGPMIGLSPANFYKSCCSKSLLKRKLEKASEIVKYKRTQDCLIADLQSSSAKLHDKDKIPLVYRVFQKQHEALEFSAKMPEFSVFAFEIDENGRRQFVTCHALTMWKLLKAKPPESRHVYEVIGENFNSKVR